jgi:hypothetical protein
MSKPTVPVKQQPVMTAVELKEEEAYKDEQEITHEVEPEEERYLPGERLLKKLEKKKRVRVKKTKPPDEDEGLSEAQIEKVIKALRRANV